MRSLSFDIYIGNRTVGNCATNIVAKIVPKFFIPKGKCNSDGVLLENDSSYYFNNIYDVGTFIADWLELVGGSITIKSTIFLNKYFLHKVFRNEDIIDCINKIDKALDFNSISDFDEL